MANSLWSSLVERLQFLLPRRFRARHPVVAVVRLTGVIGAALPFRRGLSLTLCAGALDRAFALRDAKAVALVVNSPGGSAVQSHLIFRRVRTLAEEKGIPVFCFVEDVAASGGYMIACSADEIFADPSSLVGSIGVVAAGFGFDRLIDKLGIERRMHTMGERKGMLDPFRPEQPEDIERLKGIQARVHEAFAGLVQTRRDGRLHAEPDHLFSGAIWTGAEGFQLGLVDGLGDLRAVMRERFGEKVRLHLVSPGRTPFLARWLSRSDPTEILDAGAAIAALEERAAWARWGL